VLITIHSQNYRLNTITTFGLPVAEKALIGYTGGGGGEEKKVKGSLGKMAGINGGIRKMERRGTSVTRTPGRGSLWCGEHIAGGLFEDSK
jgi:hypothetical protein